MRARSGLGDNAPVEDLFSLRGRIVHLLPMGHEDVDALVEAAGADRATFTFTPVPSDRAGMTRYIDRAVAERQSGAHYPFVTYSLEERRVVGATRFYDLSPWDWTGLPTVPGVDRRPGPDVACIGYTWLEPSAQRTGVNTEAKLLMMGHAFERWRVRAVRIQTDARNLRSRTAIERLGCVLDGVIRAERPAADGTVRDTAVYSMLAAEWPAHRYRLRQRLTR